MRNSECLFRIRWWFFVHQLNLFVFIMFSSEFFSPKIVISDQNRSRIAFQKKKNSEMKIRYFFCFICFGSMWVIFYLEFSSQFPLMILFLFRWMQNDMYPSKYLFVYVVYYLSMLAHIHLFKHTAFYRSLTRSIIIWFRFFFLQTSFCWFIHFGWITSFVVWLSSFSIIHIDLIHCVQIGRLRTRRIAWVFFSVGVWSHFCFHNTMRTLIEFLFVSIFHYIV